MEPTVQSDSFCTCSDAMRRGDLWLTCCIPSLGVGAGVLGAGRSGGRGSWARLRSGKSGHGTKSYVTTEYMGEKEGFCLSVKQARLWIIQIETSPDLRWKVLTHFWCVLSRPKLEQVLTRLSPCWVSCSAGWARLKHLYIINKIPLTMKNKSKTIMCV